MTTSPIGDRAKMYVGGAWVGATNDRAMAVSNPATGEVLAHVPDASREDVWRAIDQAAAAFPKWAHAPAIERGRILRRIYDLMTERREILARVVTQENGKPIEEAKREGAVAGKAFLNHPAVRKIAFTGSTEVGKRLMAGASEQLKRISFELGSNAPFIVFEDADLAAAADGAVSIKFLRVGGQSCICANR